LPFAKLLHRFWPDCPWSITLLTNHQAVDLPGIRCLPLGEDRGWAGNMLAALDQLSCDRILYLQDDYFLQAPVCHSHLINALLFAEQHQAGYLRLSGAPDPDGPRDRLTGIGSLSSGLKFRVSLQAAWWQRNTLERLLVPGETGWQMEIEGTVRSRKLDEPFLGVSSQRPVIDYYRHTGILKGKWVPGALRLCKRHGITVDTSRRETHGDWPFVIKDIRDTPVVSTCRRWLRRLRGRAA
jgi:hypothetical protein